jgi:hypothetical protein
MYLPLSLIFTVLGTERCRRGLEPLFSTAKLQVVVVRHVTHASRDASCFLFYINLLQYAVDPELFAPRRHPRFGASPYLGLIASPQFCAVQ